MLRFSDIKIRPKLLILFIATGIIPLLIVGLYGNLLTVDSLMEKSFNLLSTAQDIRKVQVEDAIYDRMSDIEILAETKRIRSLLDHTESYSIKMNTGATEY